MYFNKSERVTFEPSNYHPGPGFYNNTNKNI